MRNTFNFNRPRSRRASALLLCTLAIAVVSAASVAILRSNQRGNATLGGTRVARQARQTADGMLQRAYAAIRLDPKLTGTISLPKSYGSGERLELKSLSPTATQIEVYLYAKAKKPARIVMVDPDQLSGVVKPVSIVKPVDPVKPAEPIKQVDPVKQVDPIKLAAPSMMITPIKPLGTSRIGKVASEN